MRGERKTVIIQIILFIITLCTTTISGAEWMYMKNLIWGEVTLSWKEILGGLNYSIPFLLALTVHEFGHYFTAKYHNIKTTLPFYIPLWFGFLPLTPSIGTMGALIRIKERIKSRRQVFDVGVAGPVAGFIVAIMVLSYGFTHLPDREHIFELHPEYAEYGLDYQNHVYTPAFKQKQWNEWQAKDSIEFYSDPANEGKEWYKDEWVESEGYPTIKLGTNLLMLFFTYVVADDPANVPNGYELYHYPWLFAGFLALFFTAINLLPIGQLDGGHVLYGLFGYKKAAIISKTVFVVLVLVAGFGSVTPNMPINDLLIGIPLYVGLLFFMFYSFESDVKRRLLIVIWIFIAQFIAAKLIQVETQSGIYLLFLFIIGRILGVTHPPSVDERPLDLKRKVVGWLALVIFLLSFAPLPFVFQ